ncbi:MAG: proton-conducting transporter membrane subunit, partial [Bacteroidota bacterium]
LIVYLSIELVSFVSYILTNFTLQKRAHEAAIKYLLFGALTSAIILFGVAITYNSQASIYISEWSAVAFNELFSQVGLLFIIFGLFFKISIFPFHIWTPAVYQSAPNDAVAVMSVVPKLAGLVLLGRILSEAQLSPDHWVLKVILWSGIATILIGTLGAIKQSNTRRMISFGAIAHSGFMLPLVIVSSDTSRDAFWLYSVIYALMNMMIFYLVDRAEAQQMYKNEHYQWARKEVVFGVSLVTILLSLVGLPPFAGFTAKFLLFATLWENYELSKQPIYIIYLSGAVLASVFALFYYMRLPFNIYISLKKSNDQVSIKFSNSTKFIATLFAIALLLFFFVPELVMEAQQLLNNVHE